MVDLLDDTEFSNMYNCAIEAVKKVVVLKFLPSRTTVSIIFYVGLLFLYENYCICMELLICTSSLRTLSIVCVQQ